MRALIVSLVALAASLALPNASKGSALQIILLIVGLTGTLVGLARLLMRGSAVRRQRRPLRGQGVIARWTIDPARWERFRQESRHWDQQPDVRPNNVNLAQPAGPDGLLVIVTDNAIMIGADLHALEKDVAVRVHSDWIEFDQAIRNPHGPGWHLVLRVPLAANGAHDAAVIVDAYR